MLTLYVHNDSTGPDESSNYNWTAKVNLRTIAHGRFEGYDRSRPWYALIHEIAEQAAKKDART